MNEIPQKPAETIQHTMHYPVYPAAARSIQQSIHYPTYPASPLIRKRCGGRLPSIRVEVVGPSVAPP